MKHLSTRESAKKSADGWLIQLHSTVIFVALSRSMQGAYKGIGPNRHTGKVVEQPSSSWPMSLNSTRYNTTVLYISSQSSSENPRGLTSGGSPRRKLGTPRIREFFVSLYCHCVTGHHSWASTFPESQDLRASRTWCAHPSVSLLKISGAHW